MKRVVSLIGLAVVLALILVGPAGACDRCGFALVCSPNCQVVEFCYNVPFPQLGFPYCSVNLYGCRTSGPACLWA